MGNQTFCSCVTYQKKNEKSNIIMDNLIMELDQGTNKDIASSNRQLFMNKNSNKAKSEPIKNTNKPHEQNLKNEKKISINSNIIYNEKTRNNKPSINSNTINDKSNKNNNHKENLNKKNKNVPESNKINSNKINAEYNNDNKNIIKPKKNAESNNKNHDSSLKTNLFNIENKNCNNSSLKQNNESILPKVKKIKSHNEENVEKKIEKEIGLLKKEVFEKRSSCQDSCLPFVKIHMKSKKN